jgi:hypothetical protein
VPEVVKNLATSACQITVTMDQNGKFLNFRMGLMQNKVRFVLVEQFSLRQGTGETDRF